MAFIPSVKWLVQKLFSPLNLLRDYKSSISAQTTTGNINSGSNQLTLAAAIDFQNGQGIVVANAIACGVNAPAAATATPQGTAGSITDTYSVAALDGLGGCSAAYSFQTTTANISFPCGYEYGASGAGTDITGLTSPDFNIAVDGGSSQNVIIPTAGNNTGAKIALAMQLAISAFLGSFTNVRVIFDATNARLIIFSGSIGLLSSIVVTAGTYNDCTATLKIGAANGAIDVAGSTANHNALSVTAPSGASPAGYAWWHTASTRPGATTGFIGTTLSTTLNDLGINNHAECSPPVLPAGYPTNPPLSAVNSPLIATIVSGAGTTTLTLLGSATRSVTGATVNHDNTAAFQTAVNVAMATGGELELPASGTLIVTGQITLPNNSASPPVQNPLRLVAKGGASITGAEHAWDVGVHGGSVLDMRYNGMYSKILTLGAGLLEIPGSVTFTDTSGGNLPWIYTTNTTLRIGKSVAFIGSKTTRSLCDQDCIVLGGSGTTTPSTGSPTDPFQGYGTIIDGCYLNNIRRAVLGRTYANAVVIKDLTFWASCGTNLVGGAAIEFAPPASSVQGASISGILFETLGYAFAIKLLSSVSDFNLTNNMCYDSIPGNPAIANVYLGAGSGLNYVLAGEDANMPAVVDNGTGNIVVWARGKILVSASSVGIFYGSGGPNGVVKASPGSIYMNQLGGDTSTLFMKASGVGNTGWVSLQSAGQIKVTLTNLVVDGNITSLTGWSSYSAYCTLSQIAGTTNLLKAVPNGHYPLFGRYDTLGIPSGHKLYIQLLGAASVSGTVKIQLVQGGIGADNNGGQYNFTFPYNTSGQVSTLITAASIVNGFDFAATAYSLGGSWIEVGNVLIIDLTAAFGAGSEPSQAWCDSNLTYFDGSRQFTIN